MRAAGRFMLDVALRLVLLSAVTWLFGWLILDLLSNAEDADIGGGILVMLIVTGTGAVAATWDGHRAPLPRTLALWTVVALLASVASALWLNVIQPDTVDRDALRRDLVDPFWTLWIVLPAYLGVLLGAWIRSTGNAKKL